MHKPFEIANFFLAKASLRGEILIPLRLFNFVYFAHGWNLHLTNNPLIEEPFKAWRYGPIADSLYDQFKHFGAGSISSFAYEPIYRDKFHVTAPIPLLAPSEIEILDRVWEEYENFDNPQLSMIVKAEGSPWDKVYQAQARNFSPMIIPNEDIKEHFDEKAKKKQEQLNAG